jgi:hemerythrin-like metal-binding protein
MDKRPEFSPRFLLDIEQMDREHQRLFEIAGRIHDTLSDGSFAARSAARIAVSELLDYTATHFTSEEKLMAEAGYSELAPHHAVHRALITQARDMEMRLETGEPDVPRELNRFIYRWLVEHIMTNDRKFAEFVAARK